MKGDSKFILPLYAQMMGTPRIAEIIPMLPDEFRAQEIRQLTMFGIPVERLKIYTKEALLAFVLEQTLLFVDARRKSGFRQMQKTSFRLYKALMKLPEEARSEFLRLMGRDIAVRNSKPMEM